MRCPGCKKPPIDDSTVPIDARGRPWHLQCAIDVLGSFAGFSASGCPGCGNYVVQDAEGGGAIIDANQRIWHDGAASPCAAAVLAGHRDVPVT